MKKISKPTGEYPEFYKKYMDQVPEDGALIQHLKDIQTETEELITGLTEEQLLYSYSTGKWTIKDIIVHLSDCERVLTYRVMRIARADQTPLPGFDEDLFAAHANANKRSADNILNELSAMRTATLAFTSTLDDESLDRTGTANGFPLSARLLVNHIYGHHRHHLNIIRDKYLR